MHHRGGGAMGTSDFSSLMANVARKSLRNAYEVSEPTFLKWARRAPNVSDFKNITVVSLSGAPTLLKTNEHGEIKYGTMGDSAETYRPYTYSRIVSLTRQAIMNDDLGAFDRLITAFGIEASQLENRQVYAELTNNAAMADTVALFHADHSNLGTGTGSALQLSSLSTARTAMRLQKGLGGESLNISPSYLIVPAALETTASQLTSPAYVPAVQSNINDFRTGGRSALEPIVEPILDAVSSTAWYVLASPGRIDTVEYCYLDGAEGPIIESQIGFEMDGISYKCREDFATKAIDYRGLYKANGA
jgi:Mu-like prophage major head subunit gpT